MRTEPVGPTGADVTEVRATWRWRVLRVRRPSPGAHRRPARSAAPDTRPKCRVAPGDSTTDFRPTDRLRARAAPGVGSTSSPTAAVDLLTTHARPRPEATRDPPRLAGGEEHGDVRDVRRGAHAAERYGGLHLGHQRGGRPAVCTGAWYHGVAADAEGAQVERRASGVRLRRGLRGAVGRPAREGAGSVRRDVDGGEGAVIGAGAYRFRREGRGGEHVDLVVALESSRACVSGSSGVPQRAALLPSTSTGPSRSASLPAGARGHRPRRGPSPGRGVARRRRTQAAYNCRRSALGRQVVLSCRAVLGEGAGPRGGGRRPPRPRRRIARPIPASAPVTRMVLAFGPVSITGRSANVDRAAGGPIRTGRAGRATRSRPGTLSRSRARAGRGARRTARAGRGRRWPTEARAARRPYRGWQPRPTARRRHRR